MKKSLLVSLFCLLPTGSLMRAHASEPCQCFCSYLCEYRDKEEKDKPFIDPVTGLCFCAQRDKERYTAHACPYKTKPVVLETCCSTPKKE